MKINLTDLTFIIPIRIDSIIRVENLLMVTEFLQANFDCKIYVLEASKYENGILTLLLPENVRYNFIEDKDPIFHRTKYLNIMTKNTDTPFIAIWDADVIIDKKHIIDSIEQLRSNKADIAYPYDGKFYDTSEIVRDLFFQKRDISLLHKHKGKMELIYGENHKGGAIMVNKEAYVKSGMEDENFYGWGPEDFERYERWSVLKYKIHRSDGVLYHLNHSRDFNSSYRSEKYRNQTLNIVQSRRVSSYKEVVNEIEIGKLTKKTY